MKPCRGAEGEGVCSSARGVNDSGGGAGLKGVD